MTKKLSIDFIRESMNDRGWTLISNCYTGSQNQLHVMCPNNHKTTITWNNFQKGQGCKHCAGNLRWTLEEVRNMFTKEGCEYLESDYVNSVATVNYRCSCGTLATTTVGNFKEGRRCQNCKFKTLADLYRTPFEEVKAYFEKHACQLLSTKYIDNRTNLEFICKCGRRGKATFSNFQKYPNCRECGKDKKRGDKCYRWNPDREAVALNKRFQKTCERFLRRAMKKTAQKKTDHTYKMLGYTAQQLRNHIYKHPDMKALIGQKWHIDHIFPIKAFLDYGIHDLKIINALDNLRPMTGVENSGKGAKYSEIEFEIWLKKRGD